ncbi:MAG: helix-hairpin-helix domain-containing protein, partial [Bacteroidaceae bacterium]|nr:helix-hairpin-helix domain-containing protein [Bacteroidaceae bacterium]
MRRFPFLSRGERRALLLLEWLLVLALLVVTAYVWRKPISRQPDSTSAIDSSLYSMPPRSEASHSPAYTYGIAEEPVETFPFDPNTADSSQLLRLGLAPWQVRAIYRYRAKHGRYHTAEDFKRLPGMTGELWERLGPCVRIAERFRYIEPEPRPQSVPSRSGPPLPAENLRSGQPESVPSASSDSASSPSQAVLPVPSAVPDTAQRVEKFAPGTTVDINEADTTTLKRIPG